MNIGKLSINRTNYVRVDISSSKIGQKCERWTQQRKEIEAVSTKANMLPPKTLKSQGQEGRRDHQQHADHCVGDSLALSNGAEPVDDTCCIKKAKEDRSNDDRNNESGGRLRLADRSDVSHTPRC